MFNFQDNPFTKTLHKHPYQICTNCVIDTSDPWVQFDSSGVCNHCNNYYDYMTNVVGTKQ